MFDVPSPNLPVFPIANMHVKGRMVGHAGDEDKAASLLLPHVTPIITSDKDSQGAMWSPVIRRQASYRAGQPRLGRASSRREREAGVGIYSRDIRRSRIARSTFCVIRSGHSLSRWRIAAGETP